MTNRAAEVRRRRRVVAATSVVGAGLLGASLSAEPHSTRFYTLSLGAAGTWLIGGVLSGPLPLGSAQTRRRTVPVIEPIATGATAFALFYGAARVARRIPILTNAIASVLQYAHRGSSPLVFATTLANGLGEEAFFRGAVYAAIGANGAAPVSTAVYAIAATATRNPALVLASTAMGALFALQRRNSGGILAPILTHLTWSTLMLRYLPPLFPESIAGDKSSAPVTPTG